MRWHYKSRVLFTSIFHFRKNIYSDSVIKKCVLSSAMMGDNSSLSGEIKELIKTDGEIENILTSQLETLEKWRKINSSLSHSSWSTTSSLRDISKENEHLSEKIKKTTKAYEDYNKKLKLIKSKKLRLTETRWQRFMEDSQYYQHFIISAREEYKSDNLISDIHRYDVIYEELSYQNLNISRHMEELIVQYGLSELGTNIKAKHLEEIQSFIYLLKKYQLPMSIIIRNYENEKNSIIKKTRQKESDIKYLMNKKN